MAKHIYLRNVEHGYLYRVYPKLTQLRWDTKKQTGLFIMPPESNENDNIKSTAHGIYHDKYQENKMFIVVLTAHASFVITDEVLEQQEHRDLKSELHVEVSEKVYKHEFVHGCKYLLSIDNVRSL